MMTADKLESHLKTIAAKHDELDKMINEAYTHHYIDDNDVHRMKLEKLHLKEEMEKLKSKIKVN